MSEPSWLTVARRELGVKEISGSGHNARILQYLATGSVDTSVISRDETPWCAGFVNWCMRGSGWGLNGTGSLMAKSFRNYGRDVSVNPPVGAIAVFDRPPNPASGHVAFFLGFTEPDGVEVLGGNQSDAVTIQRYKRSQLIALRWPNSVPLPGEALDRAPIPSSAGRPPPPRNGNVPPRREPPSEPSPEPGGAGGFVVMVLVIALIASLIATKGEIFTWLGAALKKVF